MDNEDITGIIRVKRDTFNVDKLIVHQAAVTLSCSEYPLQTKSYIQLQSSKLTKTKPGCLTQFYVCI